LFVNYTDKVVVLCRVRACRRNALGYTWARGLGWGTRCWDIEGSGDFDARVAEATLFP